MSGRCELWIVGTDADLDAVVTAVGGVAHITHAAARVPLGGADRGRSRLYLRLGAFTRTGGPAAVPSRKAS